MLGFGAEAILTAAMPRGRLAAQMLPPDPLLSRSARETVEMPAMQMKILGSVTTGIVSQVHSNDVFQLNAAVNSGHSVFEMQGRDAIACLEGLQ